MNRKWQRLAALTTLFAATTLATGCGEEKSDSQQSKADDENIQRILTASRSDPDTQFLNATENRRVAACMDAKGFKFFATPGGAAASSDDQELSLEKRRAAGYGFFDDENSPQSTIGDGARQGQGADARRQSEYLRSLPQDQQRAFEEAFQVGKV